MARIGMMLGQYKIVREIGRGGMGVVYEAEHVVLDQRAAIKMLVGSIGDEEFAERFKAEARAACAAQHPSLVKVFDYGHAPDGAPFLVMEYLDGDTLRARLARRGRMPPDAAQRLGAQIAAALAAIHARGIVHRDLKPENVMLVADDAVPSKERIKLLDFGIARAVTTTQVAGAEPIIGTAAYMAPEQCVVGPVGTACDVYAAGIVLFEVLTGTPPFVGDASSVMLRQLTDDVSRDALGNVPSPLREAIFDALAKEPTRRPSAQQLADRLTEPRDEPGLPAPTAIAPSITRRGAPRRLRTMVSIGGALAMCGLVAAWMVRTDRPPVALTGMVAVPGGRFTMGRTAQEIANECVHLGAACRQDVLDREQPARQVEVSPFFIDAHEVTNDDFATWLNVDPAQLQVVDDGAERPAAHVKDAKGVLLLDLLPLHLGVQLEVGRVPHFSVRPGYAHKPVVQVSWDAARRYCEARGKRLPTEAEWERAARRSTARRYPWGDDEPNCDGVVFGREPALPCAAHPGGPVDVGTMAQDHTPDGIVDLAGNASEWVFDAFTLPYYPPCGDCVDPRVDQATSEGEDFRVFRGASWVSSIWTHVSARGRWKRGTVGTNIGFRCAVSGS